jgi:hypothetical protein
MLVNSHGFDDTLRESNMACWKFPHLHSLMKFDDFPSYQAPCTEDVPIKTPCLMGKPMLSCRFSRISRGFF